MEFWEVPFFIFAMNSAIDTGKYQGITIEEVEPHLDSGDLFAWLEEKIGKDLTEFPPSLDTEALTTALANIYFANSGNRMRRKFGVEKSGLCALIAVALEHMQQEAAEKRNSA